MKTLILALIIIAIAFIVALLIDVINNFNTKRQERWREDKWEESTIKGYDAYDIVDLYINCNDQGGCENCPLRYKAGDDDICAILTAYTSDLIKDIRNRAGI